MGEEQSLEIFENLDSSFFITDTFIHNQKHLLVDHKNVFIPKLRTKESGGCYARRLLLKTVYLKCKQKVTIFLP